MDRFIVKDEEFENKVKIENANSATINNINIVREKESDLNFDLLADQSKISNNLTQEIMDTDISDDEFNDLNLNNQNNIEPNNNEFVLRDNNSNLDHQLAWKFLVDTIVSNNWPTGTRKRDSDYPIAVGIWGNKYDIWGEKYPLEEGQTIDKHEIFEPFKYT